LSPLAGELVAAWPAFGHRRIVRGCSTTAIPATLAEMSHPTLGRPPRDMTAGYPDAASRLKAGRGRIAARALEIALADDPGMRERYDEVGLRQLLRDTELLVERVALSVAANDPYFAREYAGWTVIVYRRRKVPMDDLVGLCEGIRQALASVLSGDELAPANAALDDAIEVYRWSRRLAGDARKKNAFLQFIYKGG
jgi:hypothetical protein